MVFEDFRYDRLSIEEKLKSLSEILISKGSFSHEQTPEMWKTVLDVNLTGTYLGIRAAVPSMRRAGGGSNIKHDSRC